MVKPKLFSYKDSGIYYQKYKISPDRHFDRLCEIYNTKKAVEIIDANMIKAWEDKWKRDLENEKERQRILTSECPFE